MNDASFTNPQDFRDVQAQSSTEASDMSQALREFHVMLRYALAEGSEIDEKTREVVAAVAQAQPKAFAAGASAAPVEDPKAGCVTPDLNQLMAAHAALAKVVAPATPRSVEATEPVPGWLGSLRRPPLVLAMIVIALIAALGFIVTSVMSPEPAKSTGGNNSGKAVTLGIIPAVQGLRLEQASFALFADPEKPSVGVPPDAPSWQKQLNWCFAAALGAVFYVLFTVHDYVKNRTFDPRYNSLYLIRFVLGVLAGLILANVAAAPLLNKNETVRTIGPAVVALLGGFSTEGVYQVLQRLVDLLLAAVRGDNSDAAKTKASQTAQKELLSLAGDPTVTPVLLNKIHAAVQKVAQ